MSDSENPPSVRLDNPITSPRHDALGRREAAKSFAQSVLRLDASDGAVVGVFGPWGSGKTSFLKLVKHELEGESVHILEFNPWMFSGTEQLVQRFFIELSSQTKGLKHKDLRKIGTTLKDYGNALRSATETIKWFVAAVVLWLIALAGPTGELFGLKISWTVQLVALFFVGTIGLVAAILTIAGTFLHHRRQSIHETRKRVDTVLRNQSNRVVVILDDVDRLTRTEIQEVFRLVRLVAKFPRITYIIACDRDQVTKALDQGDRYLEKIVQVPFNLPEVPRYNLEEQAIVEIEAMLGSRRIDEEAGYFVLNYVVLPLISNVRDLRRYTAAAHETVTSLDDKVALSDILALEAIRVFLPDTFDSMAAQVDLLTFPTAAEVNVQSTGWRELLAERETGDVVDQYIRIASEHKILIRNLFGELNLRTSVDSGGSGYSHNSERYLRERRVACRSVMRLYLERVQGWDMVTLQDADRALQFMDDAGSFMAFFREMARDRWPYVLAHLRTFSINKFDSKHTAAGTVGLLNLFAERQDGTGGYVTRRNLFDIIRKLLQVWESDGHDSEKVIRRILWQMKSLTGRAWLIQIVEGEDGDARITNSTKLLTESVKELRKMIRSTDADLLVEELDLIEVLRVARREIAGEDNFFIPNDPEITFHLLYQSNLSWDFIEKIFDGKDEAEARIECMIASRGELEKRAEVIGFDRTKVARLFDASKAWSHAVGRQDQLS